MRKEYTTVQDIIGPLMLVKMVKDVGYGELAEIEMGAGATRHGRVLEVEEDTALVQVFEGTSGLTPREARVRFLGKGLEFGVSPDVLGRIFDGAGRPIDGGPPIMPEEMRNVNGSPINPCSRDYPNEFIETGVSSIDAVNTLVRGQKLPIFSGAGLPHGRLAAQIARQAKVLKTGEKFSVVFAAMGITFEEAIFFRSELENAGAMERSVLFLNLANDPTIERITIPQIGLTVAEYLAFSLDMHVLVILIDMTNYCEALREISAARKEVPSRRGYPGYLYTDLSTIYERAGRIRGKKGSITQIPVLTMPDDDKTHPVPDLTGYITEGQIILSRALHNEGIYPPVDVLPSLSRLKDKGIGPDRTREDHSNVMNQLYAAYAHGKSAEEIAVILGEAALSEEDLLYIEFAKRFEREFVGQSEYESRSIFKSLDIGWELLRILPRGELKRIRPEFIDKYYSGEGK